MKWDDRKLVELIQRWPVCRVRKESIMLASGTQSYAYFDWGGPLGDIKASMLVAQQVLEFTNDHRLYPNHFLGVPEGTSVFANYCNFLKGSATYALARKMPKIGREFPESHYVFTPSGKVLILEDTLTSGKSIVEVLEPLLDVQDVEVMGILALTNRMAIRADGKTGEEFFKENYGLETYWLSEGPDFIPRAYEHAKPVLGRETLKVKRSLEEEFRITL